MFWPLWWLHWERGEQNMMKKSKKGTDTKCTLLRRKSQQVLYRHSIWKTLWPNWRRLQEDEPDTRNWFSLLEDRNDLRQLNFNSNIVIFYRVHDNNIWNEIKLKFVPSISGWGSYAKTARSPEQQQMSVSNLREQKIKD